MTAQAQKKLEILKVLGNPLRLHRELQSFRKAARALSSDHPRLIDQYPNQWVVVYRGRVAAHGATLSSVLAKMKRNKIPQRRAIVRYIEKNRRTMILCDICSMADSGTRAEHLTLKR